jgi:hypothetical protein
MHVIGMTRRLQMSWLLLSILRGFNGLLDEDRSHVTLPDTLDNKATQVQVRCHDRLDN